MKMQIPNTHMQGVLGYREVLQNHDLLSREPKRTLRQIKNFIAMTERCSKAPNLEGEKKAKLKDIADTWKKFL
jgi:hypothetical protein